MKLGLTPGEMLLAAQSIDDGVRHLYEILLDRCIRDDGIQVEITIGKKTIELYNPLTIKEKEKQLFKLKPILQRIILTQLRQNAKNIFSEGPYPRWEFLAHIDMALKERGPADKIASEPYETKREEATPPRESYFERYYHTDLEVNSSNEEYKRSVAESRAELDAIGKSDD